MNRPFHAAYHVCDLAQARTFYRDVLGCTEGRSTESWIDFDFFGNQISLHLGTPFATTRTGYVGEHKVLMPHIGVVLPLEEWLALSERLTRLGTVFEIPPVIRFAGEPGEQRTMFFLDPSGNPLEIKGFQDFNGLFAH
ncbi:VOC family protein [Pseudomonas sp. SWRI153]|uniref:VOC family protein n=1 Tax=Pseudomonas khorasanensis TaxID=2745508 RepID=A0A923F7A1_9PSED|nr:VOC family protein [Pseudomonas khorasanensis]MBV4488493.1 VOC family protein [Pseudomonas khorasanensis]